MIKNKTDYSIIQGEAENGGWMLRSPCFYEENYIALPCLEVSRWYAREITGLTGVVPAIEISLI